MENPFLHDWEESEFFGMVADFEGVYMNEKDFLAQSAPYNEAVWLARKEEMSRALNKYEGIEILLASYTYEDYSGSAFVLFKKDGNLFEVHGSHCSCFGLEGQWAPELTTWEALAFRLKKGHWSHEDYAKELRTVISENQPNLL